MYYAKQIDGNGTLVALHSMSVPFQESGAFFPITGEEYLALMAEIEETMEESGAQTAPDESDSME